MCATFCTNGRSIYSKMIRPLVTTRMAVDLAKDIFNLKVNESSSLVAKEQDSFEARCFYIRGSLPHDRRKEREFALKICKFQESQERGIIEELNDVMIYVNERGFPCSVPQRTVSGELYEMREFTATPTTLISKEESSNSECTTIHNCAVRLLSFIPGQTMRTIPCSLHMFFQVGGFAARLDKILKNFECPMMRTRSLRWDLNNLSLATKVSYIIREPHHKQLLHHVENIFETEVVQKLDSLPKQCIHADINETNIIFQNVPGSMKYKPAGVIDFDLTSYNCRVFEISASAAYMMTLHLENPVEAGAYAVAGYQLENPLSVEESDLIFYLIQTRLYLSVCYGTLSSQLNPENSEYLSYTLQRALKVLDTLVGTSKNEFDERWKQLCTVLTSN